MYLPEGCSWGRFVVSSRWFDPPSPCWWKWFACSLPLWAQTLVTWDHTHICNAKLQFHRIQSTAGAVLRSEKQKGIFGALRKTCVCVMCVDVLRGESIWIIETKRNVLRVCQRSRGAACRAARVSGDPSIRRWAALLPADLRGRISFCHDKSRAPRSSGCQRDDYFVLRRFNFVSCSVSLRIQS